MENKYRKPDQEYIDNYDRTTIKTLKGLEKESSEQIYVSNDLENIPGSGKIPSWVWDDPLSKFNPTTSFFQTAINRAQMKDEVIISLKRADEGKDQLVMNAPIPQNIKCKKCDSEMHLEGHLFKEDNAPLLFLYTCPNNHPPKKAIYPNGKEWTFPKKRGCDKCGSEIYSKTDRKGNTMIFTDTCSGCGDVIIDEYDIEPIKPINEEERKKYCTDWIKRKSFNEDVEDLIDFAMLFDKQKSEKEIKEYYEVDKIEKINVPKLEARLAKIAEELEFTKFNFDNTTTKGFVIASFSVQDPSDRAQKDSINELTTGLKESLFLTNWRLMSDGIDYRLGVLSGRLKAFEDDEGLLKIAKEIYEYKKNLNQTDI